MIRYKKNLIHRKIFLYLMYSIVFAVPIYGRLLPYLITGLILNWLAEGSYVQNFRLIFKERPRFLLFSFSFLYLLYLIGLAYTSNFQYAGEDLMTKLSMLIFPFIFATSAFPLFTRNEGMSVLKVFTAGCIAGSLILTGRALYNSVVIHQPGAFFYTGLSWSFHPSYYAMYLNFVFSNILFFVLIRQTAAGYRRLAGHVLMLIFFTLMVVLLSSKAGLLIWLAVVGFYTFILLFKLKRWRTGLGFAGVALPVFFLLLFIFPNAVSRVTNAKVDLVSVDSAGNPGESTGERLMIWRTSKELITEHFMTGVGTGDVKDVLLDKYREKKLNKILNLRLNAHNQFLQTFITLGVFGFILLLAMFVAPAVSAFTHEHYIYCAFLIIVGISILVESMFETQAGVVFYAVFNAFLYTFYFTDPFNDPQDILVGKAGS